MLNKINNFLSKLELNTIYFTAAAIILAGFLRLINYKYSAYILNYCMIPYIATRGIQYLIIWRKKTPIDKNETYRLYVFLSISLTVILSMTKMFSADFFVMFLIMIDYLLKRNNEEENK